MAEKWNEQTAKSFTDLATTAKMLAAEGANDFNFTKAELKAYLDTLYQVLDATLTSIAALGTAANKGIYTTGVDTFAEFDLTAAGRALLDDADAAAQRTTLSVIRGIKSTVTKDLASIAGTTEATDTFTVTGAETTDTVSVSVAGGLDAGLIITNAWVSASDTVSITFYNSTGSAIDQASKDFYITVHKE